ncbi:MAG: sigma 54-interacting transcriptional regulator [Bryobacteraceae bacterium]
MQERSVAIRVLVVLKNALEQSSLRRENDRLRELMRDAPSRMIGSSPAWLRAVEQTSMAAGSDARVLPIGESGTGKELASWMASRHCSTGRRALGGRSIC